MPDPKTLRACLARFADARIAHVQSSRTGTEQELRDTAYTLCVMTGTRTVREALHMADRLLERPVLDPAGRMGEAAPRTPGRVVPTKAVPASAAPAKAVPGTGTALPGKALPGEDLPLAAAA